MMTCQRMTLTLICGSVLPSPDADLTLITLAFKLQASILKTKYKWGKNITATRNFNETEEGQLPIIDLLRLQ